MMIRKKFKIYPDTKVFVVCPASVKTGGTEVIHQLVNILQEKMDAYVYYVNIKKNPNPVPEEFEKYHCKKKRQLEHTYDNSHNILIVPETLTEYLYHYKYIQKSIWWLSVDNYISASILENKDKRNYSLDMLLSLFYPERFEFFPKNNSIIHLVQSYYAKQYLNKHGVYNQYYLSDYINDIYLDNYAVKSENADKSKEDRKDVVLYNPRKGMDFTAKIISAASGINFLPLENMTNDEIVNCMKESKIYIDFGNHPGKDRFPREAAMCGLCIITGKRGAAGNKYDVMIPAKYKFDDMEKAIPSIIECIRRCLENYENIQQEFAPYRYRISKEKDKFRKSIESIFG